ncbi:3-oxoacyl-[acyl-carrier-protein] reductase [Labrys sp. ZIDIC5]|uniref:3-oxoacyl-[acyl-carrier-protein] reductase n=1 Tax=Labrys sedimenti TaxID=3106036 RepID=UPI002AC9F488|nr:3-oxoacyl-[acyl-carrier-protein] reductase [Labrys sp. ZIDIC5]MDZ5450176.1 3-oxoacyl-[acyl-carrier-protein] reductase [Labrys sp. ZIDIC5]
MFDLTGKIALVTGATGGIGAAIAASLHRQGATVALSGTRKAVLKELAAKLGDRAHVFACDLTDKEQLGALVPSVEAALGQLDILVNNAGFTRDNLMLRMKDEDWDSVIAVNLSAAFHLSRAAVKGMLKRRTGRIINIASLSGVIGNPGQTNYAASKAGLVGMSKSLAHEVASRGITVNCIAPGFIETAMTDALNEKQMEPILAAIPVHRLGHVDEIAAAAVYLASSEAAYTTGQTLNINGGMAMI